jgi:hypothetical protein
MVRFDSRNSASAAAVRVSPGRTAAHDFLEAELLDVEERIPRLHLALQDRPLFGPAEDAPTHRMCEELQLTKGKFLCGRARRVKRTCTFQGYPPDGAIVVLADREDRFQPGAFLQGLAIRRIRSFPEERTEIKYGVNPITRVGAWS